MTKTPDRSARLRQFFARQVAGRGRATDPRIVEAFAGVPREAFAGPGPWSVNVPGTGYVETPDDDIAYLYQDTLVAIDAARGINIGEPSLHARCLDALALRAGETVLHIGAGVGYYSAILAWLVGPGGRVHAFEIEPDLAARAARNLKALAQVTVEGRSGLAEDLPKADAIYVNAGLPWPPSPWLDALRPGGRLIFPLQPSGSFGCMLRIERPMAGTTWPATIVTPVSFIGCQGGEDGEADRRLRRALDGGGWEAVRSLRRNSSPDATAWLAGEGWWLSTAPA
ncbi:MAG TPA: methyltransferase [Lichenihabitans sp.]|jgi:protein-L-isoaspartate(D-aspartate) O-methyltransferase|nr:methyltransferase [Lichenihabitans sp.]